MSEKTYYTHPSYGQIRISRIRSTGTHLYFSQKEIDEYFEIEISESKFYFNYTGEKCLYKKKPVFTVAMTKYQLSSFFSAIGEYEGVPCTIRRKDSEYFEFPPFDPEDEDKEENKKIEEMKQAVEINCSKITEIIKKKRLKNEDIDDIKYLLNHFKGIPWTMDRIINTKRKNNEN